MPRISRLADPSFARNVAEAYVTGLSNPEMAKLFNVTKDTIMDWKKDARVTTVARKLHDERVVEMMRKVDSEMHARLNGDRIRKMDDETLLKFRKELMGNVSHVKVDGQLDTSKARDELWEKLDQDPELAAKFAELLG